MKKNNKNFRRIANFAAALVLTACMTAPVTTFTTFAADGTNSITITNYNPDSADLTHTGFAAYQVFAGTYNASASNITITGWGDGVNVDAFITALKADATIGAAMTAAGIDNTVAGAVKVADIAGGWTDGSDEAEAFAKLAVANKGTASGNYSNGTISGIADGYYVVADTSAASNAEGSAWTLGLLAVAGGSNVEVSPKIGYPEVVKKVKEDDVATDGGYGAGYNDVADWDVNTKVPFLIQATMPSNIDDFSSYYMKFTDTLDDNFGNPEDIVVTAGSVTLTKDTDYTVTTTGNDMVIEIADLKAVSGLTVSDTTKVTVTYNAKLNVSGTPAEIGRDGQENKVKLTYSNDPNVTTVTGETPEDSVIVFTYELDIKKVDGATDAAIKDAQFKLSNEDGSKWAVVDGNGYFTEWVDSEDVATVLKSGEDGMFKIIGLDDGAYKLKELEWSTEYNIPTTPFDVSITADTLFTQDGYASASAALKTLEGTVGGSAATADIDTGVVSGTIENNKGSKLPETGGIGTTIFYVGGGTVAAAAGVLLITKKRMKNRK